jgi:TP901 family phage tail tape measure protein
VNITRVVLEADSSSIKAATKDLNALQGSGEKTTSAVKAIGAAFLALGAGNAIRSAITLTAEFNQSIASLSAITGATGKDLEFYREQAKEIGRTTSLSASQAAEAFKLIASAKPDLLASAESLAAVTREAVVLAEATGSTLPEAANALGSALNQFQLPASNASRVINALAASSQLGTAEVAAVTEALRNAGSAANSLGIDFESTVAGIQGLAAAGRQGADAGTALRQVMLQLEASGEQKLRPSLVGLTGALINLEAKNLDNLELMDLFGKEAFTAATALLGQVNVVAQLDAGLRGTSTAYEQANTRMNTFNGDMKSLSSAIEALQIEIFSNSVDGLGRSLAQTATGGVNFLTSNLNALKVAAELVAVLIGARMVASLGTSTAAIITNIAALATATTTTSALGVSTTTATAAQNVMAAATTRLTAALAILTGPAGIIVIAAAAMYALVKSQEATANAAFEQAFAYDALRESLHTLTEQELKKSIELEEERIDAMKRSLITMQAMFDTQGMYEDELRVLNLQVMEAESTHGLLVRQLERVRDGWKPVIDGTTSAAIAANSATNATEVLTRSTNDLVNMMDSAADASYNTASAYVQLMGTFGSVIPSIDQVTTRTTRLTEEQKNANLINRDAQDSIDGIVDSMEKQKEVSPQLVEVTNLMRNDISSAFADMMMNGENAFDAIAKSFERMIYKMIADWAAGKIMDLVSGAFSAATGGFTALLSGLGSAVSSTVGAAISGSIGAGTAAITGSTAAAGTGAAIAAGTAGAGAVAGTGAAGGGIVSGITGAVGTAASSVGGAISGAGSAAMGLLKAIPGWGWALGGAALVAKLLDDSGTMSSNSGILLSDLPGVAADRKRDTPAYASGVDPVLFARRDSFDNAMQISEALRAADSAVMELFGAAGKSFSITGPELSAFDEKGGGFGQFFGVAAEDGKVALTAQQSVEKYVRELISAGNRYTGSSINVSGSVDNMLMQLGQGLGFDGSNANGLDYVPFDGYRSILHQGEAVITAKGNDALGMMASALSEMRTIMAAVAQHTAKSARQLERWDFGGLPEERAFA